MVATAFLCLNSLNIFLTLLNYTLIINTQGFPWAFRDLNILENAYCINLLTCGEILSGIVIT